MMKEANDVEIRKVLKQVRRRVDRGTVTALDWRELAAADPEVARAELAKYLRGYETEPGSNPFAKTPPASLGFVIGFAIGVALTFLVAFVVPGLRTAVEDDYVALGNALRVLMYFSSVFPFLGAYLGWRRDQASRPAPRPVEGTLDEMLQRFEIVQRRLHHA